MGVGVVRGLLRELLTTSAAGRPSAAYIEAATQTAHVGLALAASLPLAGLIGVWPAVAVVLAGWAAWETRQIVTRPGGLKFWRAWRDSRDDAAAYAAGCGLTLADAGVWPWWAALAAAAAVVLGAAWMRRGEP